MHFFERLEEIAETKDTCLCVGLDPYFSRDQRASMGDDICIAQALASNMRIIESTHPYTACYKPNIAFYEAFGAPGLDLLTRTLAAIPEGIPFILDAKRGDIDSTARAYADSVFGELGADAVTLSPYMGRDGIEPFLEWKEKGVFVLCKTSNPGAPVFQMLDVGGELLFTRVARECSSWSERVGLVVAGNDPGALAAARAAAPRAWFLAPGIGAQGGRADEAVRAGARDDGTGVLVVAARSVAGAADPGAAARMLRDEVRRIRSEIAGTGRSAPGWKGRGNAVNGSDALKAELARQLIKTGCFRLGDFVLKSGKKSPFYIDMRRLISDPQALDAAGRAYASLAEGIAFDRLAGIPAAGLPLATAAGLRLSVPMIWPRMPVKEHGTGNKVEGEFAAGDKALLLDDLITTGASKIEAIDILRSENILVEDLVVLIERGAQGRTDMEKAGVRLHAFMHVKEFFEVCEREGLIDSAKKSELMKFVESE